jgi:hypothetical protein
VAAAMKVMVFKKPMSVALSPHCSRSKGPTRPTAFCSKTSNNTPHTTRKMMVLCERVTPMPLSAFSSCCICTVCGADAEMKVSPAMEVSVERGV